MSRECLCCRCVAVIIKIYMVGIPLIHPHEIELTTKMRSERVPKRCFNSHFFRGTNFKKVFFSFFWETCAARLGFDLSIFCYQICHERILSFSVSQHRYTCVVIHAYVCMHEEDLQKIRGGKREGKLAIFNFEMRSQNFSSLSIHLIEIKKEGECFLSSPTQPSHSLTQ